MHLPRRVRSFKLFFILILIFFIFCGFAGCAEKINSAVKTPKGSILHTEIHETPQSALSGSISKTEIPVSSQPTPTAPDPNRPYMPTRDAGDAKMLRGRCVVFDVYLSDKLSSFSCSERQQEMFKEYLALSYLSDKADISGIPLNFIYEQTGLSYDHAVDFLIPSDISDPAWVQPLYETIREQYKFNKISSAYYADNISVYFHINKSGRSYSLQCDGSCYFHEISVIYANGLDTCGNPVISEEFDYIHELLHQFGAIDLYYPNQPDDPRIAMAEAEFPNDIMRVYSYDMHTATLSEADLYAIGWRDAVPEKDVIYILPLEDKQ